jgi:hypothetical protein
MRIGSGSDRARARNPRGGPDARPNGMQTGLYERALQTVVFHATRTSYLRLLIDKFGALAHVVVSTSQTEVDAAG